jgi:hypothetical protein
MLQTTKEIKMTYKGYDITIPKGTRITHQTAIGFDSNYCFVDDLTWIPKNQPLLRHDAFYYGINVPSEYVATK